MLSLNGKHLVFAITNYYDIYIFVIILYNLFNYMIIFKDFFNLQI